MHCLNHVLVGINSVYQPPEMFYKKVVLEDFLQFTDFLQYTISYFLQIL